LLIICEITLNVIYLEKHSISGIDKMQYFLYQDFKYQVFKITNKVKSNF